MCAVAAGQDHPEAVTLINLLLGARASVLDHDRHGQAPLVSLHLRPVNEFRSSTAILTCNRCRFYQKEQCDFKYPVELCLSTMPHLSTIPHIFISRAELACCAWIRTVSNISSGILRPCMPPEPCCVGHTGSGVPPRHCRECPFAAGQECRRRHSRCLLLPT